MGLHVDLSADSVHESGVEGMTMIKLEVCIFQHARVEVCARAQLDAQFV